MKTALLSVDLQNDYFDDGKFPLIGIKTAAANATLAMGYGAVMSTDQVIAQLSGSGHKR